LHRFHPRLQGPSRLRVYCQPNVARGERFRSIWQLATFGALLELNRSR
jgi:hypothetical protein